jgi:hypothetical protein
MKEYVSVTIASSDGNFETSQQTRHEAYAMMGVCIASCVKNYARPMQAIAEAASFLAECSEDRPSLSFAEELFCEAAQLVVEEYIRHDAELEAASASRKT